MENFIWYVENLDKAEEKFSGRQVSPTYDEETETYTHEELDEQVYKFGNGVVISHIKYRDDTPGFKENGEEWSLKEKADFVFDHNGAIRQYGEVIPWDFQEK